MVGGDVKKSASKIGSGKLLLEECSIDARTGRVDDGDFSPTEVVEKANDIC